MPIKPKKNPVTKLVVAGVKAAAKAAGKKPSLKAAQKAKPLATPKSSVRVKPAAKQKPNKPDAAKTMFKNDSSRTRASDKEMKRAEKDQWNPFSNDPSFISKLGERAALRTQLKRKPNLKKSK
jgi:hypothetical protein